MKIGINTLFYIPGQVGGTETYLLEILATFAEMQSGHAFVLFTQRDNDALLRKRFAGIGWDFVLCPFSAENRYARIIREQTELPWRVWRSGVDVLWSPGYTLPLLCSCPQVVTIHDMQYKSFPEDLSTLARWTTDVLVRTAARRARDVLAVSTFAREEILKYTAARPEHVHVTLEGVDPAFQTPASVPPPVPPGYLLCVANSYPHKRVDQLIRAFAALETEIPQRLVIVGRARLGEAAVQRALAQMGLKCGGTPEASAERLWSTKGKALSELDPRMFAKKKSGFKSQ